MQKVIKEVATIHAYSGVGKAPISLLPLAQSRTEPETLLEVFQAMRGTGSPVNYATATSGLLALGEIEGLESLDAARPQDRPDLDGAIQELLTHYRNTDSRSLEILQRWLEPPSPVKLRVAATGILANIHTPEAVLVVGPALYDTEFQVRWRAIGGLSMFANNIPIGSMGPAPGDWVFRSDDTIRYSVYSESIQDNESYYLDFWRRWWSENQNAVAELAGRRRR